MKSETTRATLQLMLDGEGCAELASELIIDEPLLLKGSHLSIKRRAVLRPAGDFPAVILERNHSVLDGTGTIDASAVGGFSGHIVQLGESSSNVNFCQLSGIRIRGANSGTGLLEVTPVQGFSNYWNQIRFLHIERVDSGIHSQRLANGNQHYGITFQRINQFAYLMESDEFGIYGGAVHQSPDAIVHQFQGSRFGWSDGVIAEPGSGASRFAVLDVNTFRNQIRGVSNIGNGPIDLGNQNHIEWQANAD